MVTARGRCAPRGRSTRDNRLMATTPLPTHDAKPEPPEAPLPSDCCDSGCQVCVFDSYSEELEAYRLSLAAWRLRHPGAAD